MQTCPDCGARNEDGELFCGACGTYLEWEEQQAVSSGADSGVGAGSGTTAELTEVQPAPEPVVEPPGESAGEPPGEAAAAARGEPVGESARGEPVDKSAPAAPGEPVGGSAKAEPVGEPAHEVAREAGVEPATAEPPEAGTAPGPLATAGGPGRDPSTSDPATTATATAAAPAAASRRRRGRRSRAERTGTPAEASAAPEASTAVESPETAPVKPPAVPTKPAAVKPVKPAVVPAPVKPAAARPRRHVPPTAKDDPPPAPGDLICGACGAGNAPHRNFCRRCGASLADAPTQGRTGWWGRWRARRRARKDGPKAGTRPKQRRRRRRFPTKTMVVLVVLALLGGGGYYFRDELGTGYHTVLDRVAGNEPVNPTAVSASSSAADRGPELARDGISNRSWAPEVTGDGAGEWLQFEFAEPFRLVTVLLTAGASTEDETRLLEARPSQVRLTVTTDDGEEQITDLDIVDTGEPQPFSLPVSDVVSVRMTILDAYGAAEDVHVAVAEVEFRGR